MANSFTFVVLIYNHHEYVIDHLESIRYLIRNYGESLDIDIVLTDDFSSDSSCYLVDSWISKYKYLFRSVEFIKNDHNLGTCKSLYNALSHVNTSSIKITAADDVYSYENIFDYCPFPENAAFVTGSTLTLTNHNISFHWRFSFFELISFFVYQNRPLLDRFRFSSVTNAPSLLYNPECLLVNSILNTLLDYDLVEDWPLQIAISELFHSKTFLYDSRTFVYYRRTPGSAFLISPKRVLGDNLKIYDQLISSARNFLSYVRLCSRRRSYVSSNFSIYSLLNVDLLCFCVDTLLHAPKLVLHLVRHFLKLVFTKCIIIK